MNSKPIYRYFWIVLFFLLAACSAAPGQAANAAAETQIVATFVAQVTQTAAAASPTDVDSTETEAPEETETPFLTPTPDPYQPLLDRFRMVSVSQGNLYVRDGMGLPVQLTTSGEDHDPIISSDGKKIVFYRGKAFNNVFIINADGNNEKELINNKLLPDLDKGDVRFLTFQHGTYNLFFDIYYLCGETQSCAINVFLFDEESATFTKFAGGLSGYKNQAINFFESPDRQYLLVADLDHLDLFNMDGKIIHPDIVKGSARTDWLSKAYWLPDSSGLIAIMSTAIWRYTVKDNRAEQLLFAPQPVMLADIPCQFSISPERRWILYQDSDQHSYLGNLQDAQVQTYSWNSDCHVQWSADSQHFASQTAIGAVDVTPPITLDGHFIAWLDATHYLFSKGKGILDLQTYVAEVGKEASAVPENFIWSPVYAVLEPTPAP